MVVVRKQGAARRITPRRRCYLEMYLWNAGLPSTEVGSIASSRPLHTHGGLALNRSCRCLFHEKPLSGE